MAKIAEHNVEVSATAGKLNSDTKRIQELLNTRLGKTLSRIGDIAGGITLADMVRDGARAMREFVVGGVQMARQAEGIETAFRALGRTGLLRQLNRSVQGTVSNLELMKAAVRANNFKVPLERLATFFEFARQRAAATGESVQFLTRSIIDGIGRKSVLVMDNLGISAAELQEEIKKVGDFGLAAANIIQREMGKTPEALKEVVNAAEQLRTEFANLQKDIGERAKPASDAWARFWIRNIRLVRDTLSQGGVLGLLTAGASNAFNIGTQPTGPVANPRGQGPAPGPGIAGNIQNLSVTNAARTINKVKEELKQATEAWESADQRIRPELAAKVAELRTELEKMSQLPGAAVDEKLMVRPATIQSIKDARAQLLAIKNDLSNKGIGVGFVRDLVKERDRKNQFAGSGQRLADTLISRTDAGQITGGSLVDNLGQGETKLERASRLWREQQKEMKNTGQVANILAGNLAGLFAVLQNDGVSQKDKFLQFFTSLGTSLLSLNPATAPFAGAFGALGGFVSGGGNIHHSRALVKRGRRFTF